MKNFSYKEIIAITGLVVVIYFILRRRKDRQELLDLQSVTTQYSSSAGNALKESYFAKLLAKEKIKPSQYLALKGFALQDIINYANEIYESKGLFNDDEEKIYNIFASMKYKTIVSMVALRFKQKYGVSLQSYLQGFMNTKEMSKLLSIISKLKNK